MESQQKAKIVKIILWKDTYLVELIAECPYCKNINSHTIGHACNSNNDNIEINFNSLSSRVCDNLEYCGKCYKL